jgi:hypothetical protein
MLTAPDVVAEAYQSFWERGALKKKRVASATAMGLCAVTAA